MGIYDRDYYQDEPRSNYFRSGRSMIINLIIANVLVYILDVFIYQPSESRDRLWSVLAVWPHTWSHPLHWWQFLTYGFVHDPHNALHLIFNMLGLYVLGQEIELLYGPQLFLRMYLTALVVCSMAWSLIENLLTGVAGPLIGASGAVTAVTMLFALNFPRRTILFLGFIPMPAWALGVMLIVMNLFGSQVELEQVGESRVAYEVHLVGALFGYIFFRTRWAIGGWPRQWKSVFSGWRWPSQRPKLRVHDPDRKQRSLEAEADEVLAKLHREGEAKLTARERRILEEYSRRMQQKYR